MPLDRKYPLVRFISNKKDQWFMSFITLIIKRLDKIYRFRYHYNLVIDILQNGCDLERLLKKSRNFPVAPYDAGILVINFDSMVVSSLQDAFDVKEIIPGFYILDYGLDSDSIIADLKKQGIEAEEKERWENFRKIRV